MKQFFKFMFASMLGFVVGMVVLFFLLAGVLSAIVNSAGSNEVVETKPNSVLYMKFDYPVEERSSDNPFKSFDFRKLSGNSQPGLNKIIQCINNAGNDPNINGICLDLRGFSAGLASASEIREALVKFKSNQKFVLTYGDYYSQGAYYLASVASQVWLNPEGFVEFKGFNYSIPFVKGLLSKLEVEPQVIRHGKFKSAVEPYILDKMSDENRKQVSEYVNAFWNEFLTEIGSARSIEKEQLSVIADSLLIRNAASAVSYKFVDHIGYYDEFLEQIASLNGNKDKETPEFISMGKYQHVPAPNNGKPFTRDRIAVIYATGEIVQGEGDDDNIGGAALSKTIRKARMDDNIKAVVLRVNSPGGDAMASEVIWREVTLCKKVKPVIVSMGDVAASGGYYISCAADTIVAQPNTITGSIGVFGVIMNTKNLFQNKLGITFDNYKTSRYADMGGSVRALTESEKQIIGNWVDEVYATFITRVGDGRSMDTTMVDELGQGRVWSGRDAQNVGLVDVMGGLDKALEIAASMAALDNYRIKELPEVKDPFQQILEDIKGDNEVRIWKEIFGEKYNTYKVMQSMTSQEGIQARSWFDISLN